MPVSLHSTRPSSKRGESRLVAEEWQLQILRELHQKQPHPSIEQRRLLATQTGLNVKWIANWFKRVNRTPRKKVESLANGAPSQPQAAATSCSVSGHSLKPASVAEPRSSEGTPSEAVANSSLSGVVSDSARSTSPHSSTQPWEHPIITSELQENVNRERTVFCSHSQGASPALQVTSNSSFQHISPLGSTISHPATHVAVVLSPSLYSPSLSRSGCQRQAPGLALPEGLLLSMTRIFQLWRRRACIQSPLAPLPSMYWFLFDNDGNGATANPTPISFLAKWEDMLVLERRIRSSFDANLQHMKQAQLLELGQIKQGDQVNESGESASTRLDHSQTAAGVPGEQRLSPASSMSSIFGEPRDEEIAP
ncbi:hypothetical protein BGW80DRAFT_1454804 [Lactifluus volemus]|nr:hypothetical protein BGW80DRAFT_1454804 [Lactifluus volemus]